MKTIIAYITALVMIGVSATHTNAFCTPSQIVQESVVECLEQTQSSNPIQSIPESTNEQITRLYKPTEVYLGKFELTAYCSCEICCGEYAKNRPKDESGNSIVYGATGQRLHQGVSIAVDPNVISYNSKVVIDGREYIAQDCGELIKGNRIDIYFENHLEACKFGIQYKDVYLIQT